MMAIYIPPDKSGYPIFFLFLHEKICIWVLIRSASNEYPRTYVSEALSMSTNTGFH